MPKSQALQGQSSTVAMPMRLPLLPTLDTRTSLAPPDKDPRIINGYSEQVPDSRDIWIYKRPGISTNPLYSQSGAGRGIIYSPAGGAVGLVPGFWYVFDNHLYFNTTEQTGLIGSTFSAIPAVMTLIPPKNGWGSGETGVVIVSQYGAYYCYEGGTITAITSGAGFTTNGIVPGMVYLDSYIYAMDIFGNIFGSTNQNDPSVWNALDVVQVQNDQSQGVALARQLAYLIAFKQFSTQVFYTAGGVATTAGSPLQNIPESQLPYGCINGFTVVSLDESLLWVATQKDSPPWVARMVNLAARRVSTPAVERILNNISWSSAGQYGGTQAWSLKQNGHRFYILNAQSVNMTLVYDLDQNRWYFWLDSNGNYWPYIGGASSQPGIGEPLVQAVQHLTNGNIYTLDGAWTYPTDSGVLFPVDIYTPNFDAGIDRRKQLQVMRFNADQQSGSYLQSRYSDDDYQTWSNFRTTDLGLERPYLKNEGTFRRRAYHFRHKCPTALRIKSVDVTMDIGTI